MSKEDDLSFPNYADEEQMIGPVTVTEALIVVGSIFLMLLTRTVLVIVVLAVIAWKGYHKFKELGSANVIKQFIYKSGLSVPRSHLFNEPSERDFRE